MSKKKINRKPRTQTLYAEINIDDNNGDLKVSKNDSGGIVCTQNGKTVELLNKKMWVGYDRINKEEKKLNFFIDPKYGEINKELFLNNDMVYAVDTNSKNVNGKWHVIGVLTKANLISSDSVGGKCEISIEQIMSWEYDEKQYNLEQQTWWYACEYILKQIVMYTNPIVALVVDCDLGNIEKYNKKDIPIFEGNYLPQQIKLVYGSADAGKEFAPSHLISYTDKVAKSALNKKIQGKLEPLN